MFWFFVPLALVVLGIRILCFAFEFFISINLDDDVHYIAICEQFFDSSGFVYCVFAIVVLFDSNMLVVVSLRFVSLLSFPFFGINFSVCEQSEFYHFTKIETTVVPFMIMQFLSLVHRLFYFFCSIFYVTCFKCIHDFNKSRVDIFYFIWFYDKYAAAFLSQKSKCRSNIENDWRLTLNVERAFTINFVNTKYLMDKHYTCNPPPLSHLPWSDPI